MAKFQPKYPAEARAAIERLMVDEGKTAGQVVAMARAGELEHDGERLPAMAINRGTIAEWGRKARRRREDEERRSAGLGTSPLAKMDPAQALESIRTQGFDILEETLASVKRMPLRNPDRARLLREIARTARELDQLGAAKKGKAEQTPPEPAAQEAQEPDAAATLAERIRQRQPGGEAASRGPSSTDLPPLVEGAERPRGAPESGERSESGEGGGTDWAEQRVSSASSPAQIRPHSGVQVAGTTLADLASSASENGSPERPGSHPGTGRPVEGAPGATPL